MRGTLFLARTFIPPLILVMWPLPRFHGRSNFPPLAPLLCKSLIMLRRFFLDLIALRRVAFFFFSPIRESFRLFFHPGERVPPRAAHQPWIFFLERTGLTSESPSLLPIFQLGMVSRLFRALPVCANLFLFSPSEAAPHWSSTQSLPNAFLILTPPGRISNTCYYSLAGFLIRFSAYARSCFPSPAPTRCGFFLLLCTLSDASAFPPISSVR